MMPQITISEPLLGKLKSIAEAFVDTPETAIAKAVDFYIQHNQLGGQASKQNSKIAEPSMLEFQPDAAPDLKFTRPLSIELEGIKLPKAKLYWNTLLYEIVRLAVSKVTDTDQLKQVLLCNYVDGEGDQKLGYHFIPEANLSVQGQSSSPAWRTIAHLAKALGLKLDVTFIWEDKPSAAYRGKTGRMAVGA